MEEENNKKPSTQIEKLKEKISFLKKPKKREIETGLKQKEYNLKKDWDMVKKSNKKEEKKPEKRKISFFGKLVIFSALFFVFSLAVASYVFFKGVNVISTENVDISISGPSSIGGGEELSFQITVQNNNSVDLELTDLVVEYPRGTLSTNTDAKELSSVVQSLGTIPAGSSATHIFKSVLFGNEGDLKEILVTVEYRAADSNAIFFKERKYEVLIDSSPIVFVVKSPEKVMSGQEFETEIEIITNSNKEVKNFIFEADYPFGFDFKKANIKPVNNDNVWNLGTLEPKTKKVLKITGVLEGPDQEERTFHFYGGSEDPNEKNVIKVKLASFTKALVLKKSLIGAELVLDGDYSPEYIASSGERIRADILWSNNLNVNLTDVEAEILIEGTALNKASVLAEKGFYNSGTNKISWNRKTLPELASVEPNQNGNLSFSFELQSLSYLSNYSVINPEVDIDLIVRANQPSTLNSNQIERVETKISKKIKLRSDLMLNARSLYSVGKFENEGPLPPQVDKKTTYTVVFTVTNSSSDVSDAKVSATLPSYVEWLGVVSPSSEKITFNEVGGELVWEIGSILAGVGVNTSTQEVSFQVALVPSLSQVGKEPVLVDNIKIEGMDDFTNVKSSYNSKAVSTVLGTDPVYKRGDGVVK